MKSKLFAKYSRINILVTIAIFLIAIVAFYFTLNYVQIDQVDDDLTIEEEEILLYAKQYDQLPKTFSVEDQLIEFASVGEPFKQRYFNRARLKDANGDNEEFRQLIFGVQAGGQWYKVTVSKSLEDTNHLIQSILWITSATILLILIGYLIINHFVLKRLWQPFYNTLSIIKEFKINEEQELSFPSTSTEEFEFMIKTLEGTTKQAKLDYLSLKTFSENASHEIQTPIAIIQSKLDLLIQDEAITEKQSKILQAVYDAIQRLNRLNTSLLLLAKIENKQYAAIQKINLKKKTKEKIADFNELWQANQLEVSYSLKDSIILMNNELADILINNLLSNATKHNYNGGKIIISLTEYHLIITNTSNEPLLNEEKIFQRFYKPSQNKENNGLGLSIIKQICDASDMIATYYFNEQKHNFKIQWNSNR
jgi:signal transduction histidine kinase